MKVKQKTISQFIRSIQKDPLKEPSPYKCKSLGNGVIQYTLKNDNEAQTKQ